jgi:phosphatidylglycerophosphatase A
MGTAVAVPLAWFLADAPWWGYLLLTAAITVAGIWAAEEADTFWGTHDSGRIVIDEVAGYLVTMMFVDRHDIGLLLLGFVVFRALDITKPPPVRWLDIHLRGGAGVVLDDVAAGVYGCIVLYLADAAGVLPRLGALLGA